MGIEIGAASLWTALAGGAASALVSSMLSPEQPSQSAAAAPAPVAEPPPTPAPAVTPVPTASAPVAPAAASTSEAERKRKLTALDSTSGTLLTGPRGIADDTLSVGKATLLGQ